MGMSGKGRASRVFTTYCGLVRSVHPLIGELPWIVPLDAVLAWVWEQDLRCFAQKFPLLPINSRGIPCSHDEGGTRQRGAALRPRTGKSRLHTGSRLHRIQRSGARASRHLPQVARVAGRPAMGQAADRAVAAARSAVSVSGPGCSGQGPDGMEQQAAQGGRKADVGGVQRRVHPKGGR